MLLCSGIELAAKSRKAGVVGSLTRNHCRDVEELEAQLKAVAELVHRLQAEYVAACAIPDMAQATTVAL
jgi:nitronate monooxygenase